MLKIPVTKKIDANFKNDLDARLEDIIPVPGKYGPCVKFAFKILDGELKDQMAFYLCPAQLTPGNKLDQILKGLGVDADSFENELDIEPLKGTCAKIHAEAKVLTDGKVVLNLSNVRLTSRPSTAKVNPTSSMHPSSSSSKVTNTAKIIEEDNIPF